jgi:hypothetical protein
MARRRVAQLPLHGGKAPGWLFGRMKQLAGAIAEAVCLEFGADELLDKLADPFWFQAFGCVLGFDWHSSGLTTVTCGALKDALKDRGKDLGLYVAGGKGGASRKTPAEIEAFSATSSKTIDAPRLVYASRMSAKVDSAAVQDGYQLYHHMFCFTDAGDWAVVQQGMSDETGLARRYHWLGSAVEDFVCEPHSGIAAEENHPLFNMVASESGASRDASAATARMHPDKVLKELAPLPLLDLDMPRRHHVREHLDVDPKQLRKVLINTYESQPENFEKVLAMPGVGAKTVRSLALVGEIIYGAKPSFRDPARFSFAHGGKDGTPFPVDRDTYDRTVHVLREGISRAKLGHSDKLKALETLSRFV